VRVRHALSLAASALVVAGAATGLTYASWGQSAAVAMPVIRPGTLDLQLVGTPTWTETSGDVAPGPTLGTRPDRVTANHLATPGDSFTLRQQFRTVLEGENVAARVTVRWDAPPDLAPADGVTATYVVTMPDGTASAPAAVGVPVTVPGGTDNVTAAEAAAWGTAPWSVTVTLRYPGTAALVVAPTAVASAPVTGLGTVVVELAQVRDGDGFP